MKKAHSITKKHALQRGYSISEFLAGWAVILLMILFVWFGPDIFGTKKPMNDTASTPVSAAVKQSTEKEPTKGAKEPWDNPAYIAFISALVGALAILYTQGMKALNLRARIAIIEFLSDHKPRTRGEIQEALRLRNFGKFYVDALSELVTEGKISVKNKKYSVVKTAKA